MSFTVEQLTAIESAIASGELKVVFDGREVTYRSVDDLLKARNTVKSALQESGALTKKRRFSFVSRNMD
ncbi:hypothetical protein [uncultured Paraglaciecola sp.]|uniref:phage head-tail joining protein n=1 Tax=uncultured Paraglaciecola sp. TaxID=1765024 RepID=UPI0026113398|nr:hypothetical protein [uncultured Paraglaciecola sp.]